MRSNNRTARVCIVLAALDRPARAALERTARAARDRTMRAARLRTVRHCRRRRRVHMMARTALVDLGKANIYWSKIAGNFQFCCWDGIRWMGGLCRTGGWS